MKFVVCARCHNKEDHYVAQIKETKEIICIRCTGALIIEPIPHQYSFRYLWVKEI